MNTLVKTTTNVSPTELIFGNNVNREAYILTESTTTNVSHHEHIKELVEAQERIIKIARENQKEHDIFVIADRSKH